MHKLFQLESLIRGEVLKRPSKSCKSPYVADVMLNDDKIILAHAPSLGCNGLCDTGGIVYLSKKGAVCSYRIELSENSEGIIIGINPKLAEKIVEEAIMKNQMTKTYKREKKILNSRFDFVGMHTNSKKLFVLEVKTVPLCIEPGVASFPHGYRKKKGDPVSPRALKHLTDLIEIASESNADAIMCYVIQRGDTDKFIPSESDPIYKARFHQAINLGFLYKIFMWNGKVMVPAFSKNIRYFHEIFNFFSLYPKMEIQK
jgi:DNA-binding sugar fermentation-stimulating protein